MSLISDALKKVADQRAGRRQPPTLPRMIAGEKPQSRRRLLLLGLTILLVGAVIGVIVFNLLRWQGGENVPAESVTPTPQQVILRKIPEPPEPSKSPADLTPTSAHAANNDQRSPEKPKVLQIAAQQEPVTEERTSRNVVTQVKNDKTEQVGTGTRIKQPEPVLPEPKVETEGQPRQPSNIAKVGIVSQQSAEQVTVPSEPVATNKARQREEEAPDDSESRQRVTLAKTRRPETEQTAPSKRIQFRDSGKAGSVNLQAESTANVGSLYRKAVSYQKAMNWEKAIETYRQVLELEPMSAEVYNNLGLCYERQGNLKNAAQSYEKAININPRFYPSYNNLGIIYYKLKNFEKARAAYEQALELNPGNSQSEINLALIYERLSRDELARRTLERVLVNDPNNAEAHYNLGRILDEQGRGEAALNHYRQFLTCNPSAYPHLIERVAERVSTLEAASNK
ncbi:MAG: tetratricopeptide repeat protein [Syntrophobacterales bacterium]|jgi:tetratricopeptide (TPR) repeat protein